MNGPSTDYGILRGTDGIRYHVVGPRGGPYSARPVLTPRQPTVASPRPMLPPTAPADADASGPQPAPPTADDDVVDQAIAVKIHAEVNTAHVMARDTVNLNTGVCAMTTMMVQMLIQHQKEISSIKAGLNAHDVDHAVPLRLLPEHIWRLRNELKIGLAAQLDHISAMLFLIRLLRRLAENPDNAAYVMGPWDEAGSSDDGEPEAGPAAAPSSS